MSATSTSARKLIPKKLEEDLKNVPKFNPVMREPRRTVADVMALSSERAMYDEILGPIVNKRVTTGAPSRDTQARDSSEFTVSILTRLADAESEIKSLRRQLVEKLTRLDHLEIENKSLRSLVEIPHLIVEELHETREENDSLKSKIEDMEKFLLDYGLVWVGNENCGDSDKDEKIDSDGVSFHDFSSKITGLNSVIHQEPAAVVTEGDGRRGRLAHASERFETIIITFYRNGLMVKRGPFRPKDSKSFKDFMKDVMDGYFPSEFKDEYPDGVLFDLIDKHDMNYVEGADSGEMSSAQFLRRLPKTVIRNGEIVDIRGSIQSKMTAESSDSKAEAIEEPSKQAGTITVGRRGQVVLPTPATSLSASNPTPLAHVQVRWMDGTVLIAKMYSNDCIGDIRSHLDKHFSSLSRGSEAKDAKAVDVGAKSYELCTLWPTLAVGDDVTLADAKLVPNGTLQARKM